MIKCTTWEAPAGHPSPQAPLPNPCRNCWEFSLNEEMQLGKDENETRTNCANWLLMLIVRLSWQPYTENGCYEARVELSTWTDNIPTHSAKKKMIWAIFHETCALCRDRKLDSSLPILCSTIRLISLSYKRCVEQVHLPEVSLAVS